jgi:arylsulfatase A-like enzyme
MPNRRQFLAHGLGAMAIAASGGGLARPAGAAGAPGRRPNVLFIAIDDLNDWTGCLGGHPDVKTPNIDRLASRGVLFSRAYCSAPACNPSRASLLTGILPSTSGCYHNDQPWRPVMPDAVTLPRHFMDQGYHVAGRGKIYHGGQNDKTGWHEYTEKGGDPKPAKLPANGIPKTAHFDWGPVDVTDDDMDDTKVAKWASAFLQKEHDKPFFLAAGLFRPHLPWYVPRQYFDMYPLDKIALPNVNEDDLDDVPPLGRKMAKPDGDHRKVIESNNWRRAVQGYLASITFTDTNVGRLLDALDKSRYADNTIVILWGDHGWHLGEKLHWRKFALWEEATHAPLMIAAPGVSKAGVASPRPVSFVDIYPTLCDLCGLPGPKQLEGTSLKPLLENPNKTWDRPALTTHGRENHSVRSERWRYIRYRDGSEELYDHENDELEWTNLAGKPEHAEVKKKLAARLPEVNAEDAPRAKRRNRQQEKAKRAKRAKKDA